MRRKDEATTSVNAGPYMKPLLYIPHRKLKIFDRIHDKERAKKKALKKRYKDLDEGFKFPPRSPLVYGKNPEGCDVLKPPDIDCTRANIKLPGLRIKKRRKSKN